MFTYIAILKGGSPLMYFLGVCCTFFSLCISLPPPWCSPHSFLGVILYGEPQQYTEFTQLSAHRYHACISTNVRCIIMLMRLCQCYIWCLLSKVCTYVKLMLRVIKNANFYFKANLTTSHSVIWRKKFFVPHIKVMYI